MWFGIAWMWDIKSDSIPFKEGVSVWANLMAQNWCLNFELFKTTVQHIVKVRFHRWEKIAALLHASVHCLIADFSRLRLLRAMQHRGRKRGPLHYLRKHASPRLKKLTLLPQRFLRPHRGMRTKQRRRALHQLSVLLRIWSRLSVSTQQSWLKMKVW